MKISEHFPIVNAICRLALAQPSEAVQFQIERLATSLEQSGDTSEAKSLRALILRTERATDMTPRKLIPSKGVGVPGEVLLPTTPLPADKETGIRLVDIRFPDQIPDVLPILSPDFHRSVMQLVTEWDNASTLRSIGLPLTTSCLFVGAPGTGKTTLALWLAKQLGLPVVVARIDAMMSSFLGTSARNITQVFSFANRFRCILVLDEFDSLAKMRDDPNEVGEIKRVVNALLQNLDSRKDIGMTIGITNHPKLLDSAVWRRFHVQIHVPLPSYPARIEIATRYAAPVDISDAEIKVIAAIMNGHSGAEVEEFVMAYKKRKVLPPTPANPISAFRDIATLNSGRLSEEMKDVLFGDEEKLIAWLRHNQFFELGIVDVALLTGKGKSTVARVKHAK